MTCIAGLVHDGEVYIGGDSAGVGYYDLTVRDDEKVFCTGPFVIGFTSSFRMGQLLRYSLSVSEQPVSMKDDYQFMVTWFIDGVRTCLKNGGYAKKEYEVEQGGTFLVGYRGKLYSVEGDYQVGKHADGFAAVGCGAQVALGALYACKLTDPRKRLQTALKAAERFSGGVRGPFVIVKGK